MGKAWERGYISLMLRHLSWFLSNFNMLLAVSALETATNDGYMTTWPNSFPGSTNKLAINQVRIH